MPGASLFGQAPLFQRITEKHGLVFNEVHDLCFDQRGVLWIGTAMGLSRFDGSGFRTYTRAQGLPAPRVYDIECDSTGMLWMGTMNGVVRLDPRIDSMRAWRMDTSRMALPIANQVVAAKPLAAGKVVCVSRSAVFLLEAATGNVRRVLTVAGEDIASYNVGVLPDSAGAGAWICIKQVGVAYYDAVHDRLIMPSVNQRHPLLRGVNASCLSRDRHGRIWTDDLSDGGMNLYRPADGSLQHWPHVPGAKERRYLEGLILLHCDDEDRLWICDWVLPACVVNLRDSSFLELPAVPDDPATLTHGTVSSTATDARGQLWLGTLNGISVHDPERFMYNRLRVPQIVGDPKAWAAGMAEDDQGRVWLAVRPDVVRLDEHGQVAERFEFVAGKERAKASDIISSNGQLWVNTSKGLFRLDPITGAQALISNPADTSDSPHFGWMRADRSGRIWGLKRFNRINCYEPSTGTFKSFTRDAAVPEGLPDAAFLDMLPASDGALLLASESHGIVRLDPATGHCTSNLADIQAGLVEGIRTLAVAEDDKGRIWYMADGVGLVRYEPGRSRYKVYDSAQGLPIPAGSGIAIDRQGRLWIGLLNGLVCFDPELERFFPFDVDRGQESNDMGRAHMVRRNGEVWMSQWQELIHFDPSGVQLRKPPLAPVIIGVWAYSNRVQPMRNGELSLMHTEDQLRIRYASFDAPGRIKRYFVRVLPDSSWQEGDEGDVTFSRLAPGAYRFQFRTQAEDGQWSGITELAIRVVPPWWQTLVARIVFAVVLASLIVFLFRIRLNWVRKRERNLEAQTRQVNELKLQALRAQMDPHFVFNCLNSIDSFIIANDREQASHYLGRFAKLIRLILQHSDSTRVPLEREVEMLKYYLELETLRFKFPFTYSVKMDELLDGEPVELPSMLIQPYIENAIWHGLRHKDSAGHISVDFALRDDQIQCTVQDNGIGREASRAINRERSGVHRSMGMRVSADRLRIYGELEQGASRVTIHDLKDADGKALGTRVVILIPVMQNDNEN